MGAQADEGETKDLPWR